MHVFFVHVLKITHNTTLSDVIMTENILTQHMPYIISGSESFTPPINELQELDSVCSVSKTDQLQHVAKVCICKREA